MNPRRAAIAAAVVTALAVVAVVFALSVNREQVLHTATGDTALLAADRAPSAPELRGVTHFDNTAPLTLASLRGRVVLVDFWTYTCINCRRTFPFLKGLVQTYTGSGLTVLGVHSPEFGFEKSHANVSRAVRELGVTWPVAEDPDMSTWNAFQNEYWPADYLIDRQGKVRYFHAGEGGDAELETAVRTLLADGGTVPTAHVGDVVTTELPGDAASDLTPETYLRGLVPAGRTVTRHDGPQDRDQIGLSGQVTGAGEYVQLDAGGAITQRFHARDVYATTAPAAHPVVLDVTLDGRPVPADRRGSSLTVVNGRTVAVLAEQDLLHLVTGAAVEDGTIVLTAQSTGARFFTLTYGG